MDNLKERLDRARNLIQSTDFLTGKGLSNEVNIRIFCYQPNDEMVVRQFIEQISTDHTLACNPVICNLYHIFLSACEEMDILDAIPDMEEYEGNDFLLEQLHAAIDDNQFIEKIQENMRTNSDVLILIGVGEVFPFMRVHALLEALQPYFSDMPILVFYPGEFDGHQLKLFNRLQPNDYYRAFNVL